MLLRNDENKKRLIQVLFEVWSSERYVDKLIDRKLTFICEGISTQLTSENDKIVSTPIASINSNQEETFHVYRNQQTIKDG